MTKTNARTPARNALTLTLYAALLGALPAANAGPFHEGSGAGTSAQTPGLGAARVSAAPSAPDAQAMPSLAPTALRQAEVAGSAADAAGTARAEAAAEPTASDGSAGRAARASAAEGTAAAAGEEQSSSGRAVTASGQLARTADGVDMDGAKKSRGWFFGLFSREPKAAPRALSLAERLTHPSTEKRLDALREAAIADPKGAEHGARIEAMAGGDPDAQVRIKAGETLFSMRGDEAVPTLVLAAQAPHAATALASVERLLPMDSGRKALEAQVAEEMAAVSRGARGVERAPTTTGLLTVYRQSAKDSSRRRQAELVLKSFQADPRGKAAIEAVLHPGINYGKIAVQALLFPLLIVGTILVAGIGLLAVVFIAEEAGAGLFDFLLVMWLLDSPSGKSKAEEWAEFESDQEKAFAKTGRKLAKAVEKSRAA